MFATAILMGLAGGFHCASMCGPLVLAATIQKPFVFSKVVYSAGRVLTYSMLGLSAGVVGSFIQLTRYQDVFAFLIGTILLLTGLGAIRGFQIPFFSRAINRFTSLLKKSFAKFLSQKGGKAVFALGLLNGLLPCGLTYLAMTYCLTLTSAWDGFLFMVVFGLGTIPVMAGAMWLLGKVLHTIKLDFRKISVIVWIILGFLVVARALFSHTHNPEENFQNQMLFEEILCP